MVTLLHHPFCPHSRFVRIVLAEYGVAVRLAEERAWERREDFLVLNPAGTTPVLVEDGYPAVPGGTIIAEFIDDVYGPAMGDRRLMSEDPHGRVEVRRLMSWFNEKFFEEVSGPLVLERVYKSAMSSAQGAPDSNAIRAARHNIGYHLAYIEWLLRRRDWLAGDHLSYADIAAAAHLSIADYLGDVPWNEDAGAKNWYARIKSRPSFRPLLGDIHPGVPPSLTYADLDF